MKELKCPTVLLVDDHAAIRFLWQRVLQRLAINSAEAENGQIAVNMVKETLYSLVIMDVRMPVMNGIEATEAIRAFEKEQGREPVRIVAVTSDSDSKNECLNAGMNLYFEKPIFLDDIRKILATAAPELIQ